MIKELRIPVKDENIIDISEIGDGFKGVVICYYNGNPSGYIMYDYDEYRYYTMMDAEGYAHTQTTLLELVEYLIKEKICDNFKVIIFSKDGDPRY